MYSALPHLTAMDDEYRGYHIAKGSVVIGVRLSAPLVISWGYLK